MTHPRRRWPIVALSFAATIGVSLYVILTTWPEQRSPVRLPIGTHLLALLAVALEIGARASKISLSAAALRIRLSLEASARTVLGGDFGAAITPARSGAEPARFLILSETGAPVASVLMLLFAELFLEVMSLFVVGAALLFLVHGARRMLGGLIGLVGGYALVVTGAAMMALVLSRRRARAAPPGWAARIGLRGRRWEAVQRALFQLRVSVVALRDLRPGYACAALGMSILHVVMRLAVLPILVYGFPGSTALAPLVVWPLALFYGGVVTPVPGGGGLIEVAFRQVLGGVIAPRIFTATLIWWRFYTFYLYILLGALCAGGTVMKAIRSADDEAAGEPTGVSAPSS
ncbi:MAG: lysylphosphatidylglycerol synthase transmembrane domain-containing protein [Gemmatimonadaceae bacterium]